MTNTDDTVVTLSNGLPLPPVPARLREMLKDYPEHIERLQKALNFAIERPTGSPLFEVVIWALEDQAGGFIREAKTESELALANGGSGLVDAARKKLTLMRQVRSSNGGMKGLHELWGYVEKYKGALR